MKFGIMNLFPLDAGNSENTVLAETLEEIDLADQLGFDSVWLAEHHFSHYGILGNPLVFGAAIAERTSRVTIGTAVAVVPFHNPVRLAEDALLLDALSGGRFLLGLGRGYQPAEFHGFGIDAAEAKERYAETVDILRRAFDQECWSYDGKYFSFSELTVHPRPIRAGGPPILHGAISPDTFVQRGLAGDRIITSPTFAPMVKMKRNFDAYRDGLLAGGHNPADFELPMMQQVWCGSSEAELRATASASLNYYRLLGMLIPGSDEAVASERQYYERVQANIKLLTLEQTLVHGGNFGSSQKVIETLAQMRDELGMNHYIGWFRIPSLDRRSALKAIETFASDVMPALR